MQIFSQYRSDIETKEGNAWPGYPPLLSLLGDEEPAQITGDRNKPR